MQTQAKGSVYQGGRNRHLHGPNPPHCRKRSLARPAGRTNQQRVAEDLRGRAFPNCRHPSPSLLKDLLKGGGRCSKTTVPGYCAATTAPPDNLIDGSTGSVRMAAAPAAPAGRGCEWEREGCVSAMRAMSRASVSASRVRLKRLHVGAVDRVDHLFSLVSGAHLYCVGGVPPPDHPAVRRAWQ